ncbi:hydroxyacylglutathione hydrolase-like protein isoform X1 [Cynocephalus volans]|uniref:hydroxyacylglutathione hydrolase-like protein isoform X1 n=1 Tax=Cynocephalus volans TaxID=110931 RepID=UPI002FCA9BB3
MKVKVIPVLVDNYMYLVIEEHTREAVAVDVAVPKRLLEVVAQEGVSLTTVLTTHHHWDHARGNAELARLRPGLAVLGADERICALTRRLAHGEELRGTFCRWPAAARAWRGPLSRCTRAWLRLWATYPPKRAVRPERLRSLEGVLWPRAHTQQPRVCTESGALQRPRESQAVLGPGMSLLLSLNGEAGGWGRTVICFLEFGFWDQERHHRGVSHDWPQVSGPGSGPGVHCPAPAPLAA